MQKIFNSYYFQTFSKILTNLVKVHWKNILGVYLTFTTGGKIREIAGYTDLQSVYVHLETLENSRQKDLLNKPLHLL